MTKLTNKKTNITLRMKKILFIPLFIASCSNPIGTPPNESNDTTDIDVYNIKWKSFPVSKTEILTEGEELHEFYIIETDTTRVIDHCDNCKYCIDQPNQN